MPEEKTCFFVMGFGEKTDYQTQRTLKRKTVADPKYLQCANGWLALHADVGDLVRAAQQVAAQEKLLASLLIFL